MMQCYLTVFANLLQTFKQRSYNVHDVRVLRVSKLKLNCYFLNKIILLILKN